MAETRHLRSASLSGAREDHDSASPRSGLRPRLAWPCDPSVLAGVSIAHFRIDRCLGQGGMGIVYRAEDVLLRRAVALKVMLPACADDEASRTRFLREARTAGALAHPNIPTIFEVGESRGSLYIAMELVEGESLLEALARGPLAIGTALPIARQIALALARAHAAGVIHRDLKPENVMVRSDGVVKLLDFGIAKALGEDIANDGWALDPVANGSPTFDGAFLGTPEYMSPEQAMSAALDARSDVFSFGTVLFQLLCGRSPFRRGNVLTTAMAVRDEAPPSLASLAPHVPPAVSEIVERCLAKDASRRYADGAALLVALGALG